MAAGRKDLLSSGCVARKVLSSASACEIVYCVTFFLNCVITAFTHVKKICPTLSSILLKHSWISFYTYDSNFKNIHPNIFIWWVVAARWIKWSIIFYVIWTLVRTQKQAICKTLHTSDVCVMHMKCVWWPYRDSLFIYISGQKSWINENPSTSVEHFQRHLRASLL